MQLAEGACTSWQRTLGGSAWSGPAQPPGMRAGDASQGSTGAAVERGSVGRAQDPDHKLTTEAEGADEVAALLPAAATVAEVPGGNSVGEDAGAGIAAAPPTKWKSLCARCVFWLQNYRIRGFRLPLVVALLGQLVLPEMDAVSDILVTIAFYKDGDMNWFRASLVILALSGAFATAFLVSLATKHQKPEWYTTRLGRLGHRRALCCRLLLAAPVGLAGLAPVAVAALALYTGADEGRRIARFELKPFKLLELLFEALPQSTLQSYVAVSYGKLDPSDPERFSRLLAFSVSVSLLGAGSTAFGVEDASRNNGGRKDVVRAGSRYGLTTILLRSTQLGMLIFWVALAACAEKDFAAFAMVAAVCAYAGAVVEAAWREYVDEVLPHPNRVKVLEGGPDSWNVPVLRALACCGWLVHPQNALKRAMFWNALPPLIAGAIAAAFYSVEHYDNNYANSSAPIGPPGSPQHFDCRDRTSGIYPALFLTVASLLLGLLSLAMDPKHGVPCVRGLRLDQKWEEQFREDQQTVLKELLEQEMLQKGEEQEIARLRKRVQENPAGEQGMIKALFEQLQLQHAHCDDNPLARLEAAFHAAVLDRQVDAVWNYTSRLVHGKADGMELRRLADNVYEMGDGDRYVKLATKLALATRLRVPLAGGSTSTNEALEGFKNTHEASGFDSAALTEEQFRAACLAAPASDRFVVVWFKSLRLPLLPQEPRCIGFCVPEGT